MQRQNVIELIRRTELESNKESGIWAFIDVECFANLVEHESQLLPNQLNDKLIAELAQAVKDELLIENRTYTVDYMKAVTDAVNVLRSRFSSEYIDPRFPNYKKPTKEQEEFCDSHCVWNDHHADCFFFSKKEVTE